MTVVQEGAIDKDSDVVAPVGAREGRRRGQCSQAVVSEAYYGFAKPENASKTKARTDVANTECTRQRAPTMRQRLKGPTEKASMTVAVQNNEEGGATATPGCLRG